MDGWVEWLGPRARAEERVMDLARRLEEACLPLMEEWLADIEAMGSSELRTVPEDDLRVYAFMLVRSVIEFVAREMGADVTLDRGRQDFRDLWFAASCVIVDAIDNQVPYTAGRSERVKLYAGRLASMLGLSDEEIAEVEYAARIHNLGLVNSSQRLVQAPRKLSPAELSMARNHSQVGADIMKPIEFLAPLVPMVRFHHAHWDGTGYPPGVEGENIPLGARIIHLADAYEAMLSDRPHRPAIKPDEALAEIQRQSGKQFDPQLARIANVMV